MTEVRRIEEPLDKSAFMGLPPRRPEPCLSGNGQQEKAHLCALVHGWGSPAPYCLRPAAWGQLPDVLAFVNARDQLCRQNFFTTVDF
jgi:hypothetical protein